MAQTDLPLPGVKKAKELFQETVFPKDLNLSSKARKSMASKTSDSARDIPQNPGVRVENARDILHFREQTMQNARDILKIIP